MAMLKATTLLVLVKLEIDLICSLLVIAKHNDKGSGNGQSRKGKVVPNSLSKQQQQTNKTPLPFGRNPRDHDQVLKWEGEN